MKDFPIDGGVEKVSINLATQFISDGNEVCFYILNGDRLPTEYESVFKCFYGNKIGIVNFIPEINKLIKTIKLKDFDVIISAKEQANITLLACSFFVNHLKPIYTRHSAFDSSDQKLSPTTISFLYNLYARSRGEIVAVSRQLATRISNSISQKKRFKVHYCPNPVISPEIIKKSKIDTEEFDLPNDYICAVGRLCEQKGFDILIESYAKAYEYNPDLPDLVIVGEGSDRLKLQKQIETYKLKNKIHLYGFCKNPYYVMANSKLFILSSRNEGLPTVLIEALALNIPIVATDCPTGPREILDNGKFGQLVPVNDTEKMAEAILKSFNYSQKWCPSATEPYTYSNSAQAYYSVMGSQSLK